MTLDYRILLDSPAEGTLAMGFTELAGAFAAIIRQSEPRFAIGLFGSWGSGKTTLMRAIRAALEAPGGTEDAIVWFAAWRYEKEPHLIVPLLDTIREAVLDWGRREGSAAAKARARALAGTIGKVTASLLAGFSVKLGVPGLADLSFDANKAIDRAQGYDKAEAAALTPRSTYHASFNALSEAFTAFRNGGAERIVVFVDDLDRCLPEGALEVLESMKLFFDLSGFVFVVGLDAEVVQRFVEYRYRDLKPEGEEGAAVSGEAYLRKIFQVPFGLRPVVGTQVDDFIEATIVRAGLGPDQATDLRDVVKPYLLQLVTDQGFNPRELKRFVNAYTIQRMIRSMRGMDGPNDNRVILALQTIAFRPDWVAVQSGLVAFGEALMRIMQDYAITQPEHRHAGDFTPYLGVPAPTAFLSFLEDPATGGVLSDFAASGGQIEDFLFEGLALSRSDGGGAGNYIDAFLALGRSMSLVGNAAPGLDPPSRVSVLRDALSGLEPQLRELGIQSVLPELRRLEQAVETTQREIEAMDERRQAFTGPEEERRGMAAQMEEPVARLAQDVRSSLQSVMTELQREFRARR